MLANVITAAGSIRVLALGVTFTASAGSGITFAGGDGSTFEKAMIIRCATETAGVSAEYEYLAKYFRGYKVGRQALMNQNGRAYDFLEFTTKEGQKTVVFLDINGFFGKY